MIVNVWHDNDSGYRITYQNEKEVNRYLIYKPRYGIKQAIDGYIHYICQHPLSMQQVMNKVPVDGPSTFSTDSIGFSLSMIEPKQSRPYLDRIIQGIVYSYLRENINKNTDIMFMAKIGAQRDWSKDCSICLENKIGHQCSCKISCTVYSQITLFKPCGHSVCTPCSQKLNTCPLCRAPIREKLQHHQPRFEEEILDYLVDKVMNKSYIQF
jgi:hypothetical protein